KALLADCLHRLQQSENLAEALTGVGGDEQVPNVQSKKPVKLFSPYALHWRAYTAYEADVRGALAAEDLSFKCKFEAAELKWLGLEDGKPPDDELPTKSILISNMSDSIKVPMNIGDIFDSPKDDGKTPADLKVLFAEEIVTLASLLDKEFFVGMMCSAGNGRFGHALYSTAMAWVWAMLKLDFDPTGLTISAFYHPGCVAHNAGVYRKVTADGCPHVTHGRLHGVNRDFLKLEILHLPMEDKGPEDLLLLGCISIFDED
ncbi:MAG: hypothetical protein CMI62_00220, partial [Parvibaculum sp.]|uniref:hypothetical protein n=1 Tax=Parvibaculum sp. TaxID=2024848 RepID=UPI000C43DC96